MESPHFFLDRSLGRVRVPRLLRGGGWALTTLAEHYGVPADELVEDTTWLELAGASGWPVLMKDDRIRYRTAEREALVSAGVIAFCLTSGNLTAERMAGRFTAHRARIWRQAVASGPALFAVSGGEVRRIDLSA